MTITMLKPSDQGAPWYRMEAAAGGTAADVYIYDMIDSWWGISASTFVRDLEALDVETINLRVNSPGGSVYDGVAIMNALHRHPANVIATVDGLAASAASFIIQAADEVVMGRGTELMIHEASSIGWGNAADMLEMAAHLDRLSGTIAGIYAERAGGTAEEWRTAMQAETWYTADEAVKAGLADRVDGKTAEPDAKNRFDLSVFAHAGRRNAPAPAVNTSHERRPGLSLTNGSPLATAAHMVAKTIPTPPAEPKDNTNPQEKGTDTMSEALTQGLRERLGIPAAANLDDAGLLAAVDEALAEQEVTPAPAAAAPGTVVLDAAQYDDLVSNAAQGREARQQQLTDNRTAMVNAAVEDGRIAPARREHWVNALAADPGMAETLAGLEKGLVPVDAVGYVGGIAESTDEDRSYNHIFPKES
ncbi:head maturation protease, ClpP-related [Arthrobacter sp. MP_2.3]|uniref:head maturation protease, ClpP-related n=1 Tax=Arthrobacter sp. MP_2.3 TaxID=3349633 RepID=UPI0038D4D586